MACKLLSNLHYSEFNYDEAIFQYNQLVLNAAKEVLTALAVLRNAEMQLHDLEEKVINQRKTLELTKLRIAYHIDSSLNFLSAESNFLEIEDGEQEALGEACKHY